MPETNGTYITTAAPLCSALNSFHSPTYQQLRLFAAELHQVSEDRAACDELRNPLSAIAGDMLIADISRRVDALASRVHEKPVTSWDDLFARAALVLFWSDSGLSPEAWDDPVAALVGSVGPLRFQGPVDTAGTQLAAAVFVLAQQGGVHG